VDLKEFESLYDQFVNSSEVCQHLHSKVSLDPDTNIFQFRCPDCGRIAWGNEKFARALHWID